MSNFAQLTDRNSYRNRNKIGEKSPISLAKLAVQNFNDLQRTSRYVYGNEPEQTGCILERSPRQYFPKLNNRTRWVSVDAHPIASRTSSQKVSEAHQLQFNAPESERFRQRVSLDYSKLEQIVRSRQQSKASPAAQDQILDYVQKLKQRLPQVNVTRALVTKTPIVNQQIMSTVSAESKSSMSPKNTSPQIAGISPNGGVPQNFAYPDTNMRLTCNYFGSNDYTRKRTIGDIKDKVVEERSTKRTKNGATPSRGNFNGTQLPQELSQNQQNDLQNSWLNKTISLFSPSKLRQDSERVKNNETAQRSVTQKPTVRGKDKKEQRESTPQDCKCVQIDSQLDNSDTLEDSLYKQLDVGQLDLTSQDSQQKQEQLVGKDLPIDPPHQIQLSTHLFNGEYLLQSINEKIPTTKEASHASSRFIVPQQIIKEPHPSSMQRRSSKNKSKNNSRQNRSPPAPQEPAVHHQVTYFTGPQINQINLHVHFSKSGSKATVDNEPVTQSDKLGGKTNTKAHSKSPAAKKVKANLSKLESESLLHRSRNLLDNQGSKQTLNQSSSKALQVNNQQQQTNLPTSESPLNLRTLNKYSSLQAAKNNNVQQNGKRTRLDRIINPHKKNSSSGEISHANQFGLQQSVLGLDLNSMDSSKSSDRQIDTLKQTTEVRHSPVNSSMNVKPKQVEQGITADMPAHIESPIDGSFLLDQADERQYAQLSENLLAGGAGVAGSPLYYLKMPRAEQMINEILQQLSIQQKTATIKITTHKAGGSPSQDRSLGNGALTEESLPAAKMSHLKQSKMRRNKARPSPRVNKTLKQLNLYKAMVSKFESSNDRYLGLNRNNLKPHFNTITEGFSPRDLSPTEASKDFEKVMRSTMITQSQSSSINEQQFNPSSYRQPHMSRTIMEPGNRWNSLNQVTSKFNPNMTGFSMLTSHWDRISSLTKGNRTQDLKSLNDMRRNRPFSLSMEPERVAETRGQSTVLFKVNPNGNVGRFRPRAKRKQESFGKRNARLGYIANRTSVGMIKGTMRMQPKMLSPMVDVQALSPTKQMLSLAMMKSETTAVDKRAIERELKDLEHAMLPSTEEAPSPEPQSPSIHHTDQVIYEESLDDCNADLDDLDSHISGNLSTFASRQTSRIPELGRNILGPQLDSFSLQSKMQTQPTIKEQLSTLRSTAKLPSSRPEGSRQSENLQDIMGSLNQRINIDKSLLDKIKQISASQQRQPPRNKSSVKSILQPGSPTKPGGKTIKNKDSQLSVVQAILCKKADRLMTNQKIAPNEVLEGHSIQSLRQEQIWSMIRPPCASGRNSPTLAANPSKPSRTNQSHIVVVQTPDATPQLGKLEELRQRLDIKIRCPAQLLSPEAIKAISGKLDLSVSIVFYDGTQDLQKIQQGMGPRFVKKQVHFNAQGFALNFDGMGPVQTKWNLYDHFFRGQVALEELDFSRRQYLVEIELTEPQSQVIYLLRYLTFNQMKQTSYPKIFITIMHHLNSKKRPLHMFDGLAQEVLDFKKEPTTKNGIESLNQLFDKLVLRDLSYSLVFKNKPRVECPQIKMRGIILESPKRKVQVKGISEFISLHDKTSENRSKLNVPRSQEPVASRFHESRETLRPDPSDSQYVAVPVTNHELQARNFQPSPDYGDERPQLIRSALSKTHTSSTMRFGGAGSPRNEPVSPLPKSFSRTLRPSPLAQRHKHSAMRLNYDSATKIILDDTQATGLNQAIQVKRITERLPPKTPPRKVKAQDKPIINKQQFHIDPNLDKGIDCSFEALGSSEGRHSANPSTPPMSSMSRSKHALIQQSHKVKRPQRYSSSAIDEIETARRSGRNNLQYGSNMSEQEDENNETFGPNDRLQSIFTMNKKDSDLNQDKLKGGLLIVRGSSKEMMTMPLKSNQSKEFKKIKLCKDSKEPTQQQQLKETKETFKLPSKGILQTSRVIVRSSDVEHENQSSVTSSQMQVQQEAKGSSFESACSSTKVDGAPPRIPLYKQVKQQKETLQKSIVNLNAEEVIKEPMEPLKHRSSGLGQIKKTTMTRRSNLRHALADEKSKQLLQNEQRNSPLTMNNLQIQKKEIQEATPKARSPSKRLPQMTDQIAKEFSSADSDVVSIRRSSLASQVQVMNPKLTELGPEVIIVKKQRTGKKDRGGARAQTKTNGRQIKFERAGRQIDITINSSGEGLINDCLSKQSSQNQ